ncbi:hypothetical protein GCM10009601_08060 [Streptomyces thermospinosisporus]|uniref:Uncharacterized protein n=1 Tax=Streptomyces thermospinosisporus TaxID=161482 RepID=A0ABP4JAC0_9ACTN
MNGIPGGMRTTASLITSRTFWWLIGMLSFRVRAGVLTPIIVGCAPRLRAAGRVTVVSHAAPRTVHGR